MVILDDLGPLPHGQRFRARQGKSLLLLTVLTPEVTMQRELRDLLAHQVVLASEVTHPNLLPTYGHVRLPLGDDIDTFFLVRPDPGCPTLRQWLHEVWQAGHALDPLNAVAIAVQVCEALAALHEKFAHGYVTADNVFMYPTGGMPQALLSGTAEGVLLPFAPDFDRFVEAGYLPMAGRELFEPPHQPRVETDVLGAAGLVLEILTGQPLEAGMPLDRFGLPPRLERVLSVASSRDPEERPQDILMFSRRLQASVGLGDDPVEPSAVLEPVHHGDHADPRYPAVRAKPWRPPPPPPPPWVQAGPTPGSGAWNVGAPTPGSGAWNVNAGSGAWNIGGPTPGSGAWANPVGNPGNPGVGSGPIAGIQQPSSSRWESAASTLPPPPPPSFGRGFPVHDEPSRELRIADPNAPAPGQRPVSRTHVFGAAPPPPPVPLPPLAFDAVAMPSTSSPGFGGSDAALAPPPSNHSVSIMMPAPDGSVMAQLSRGPANYVIVRKDKRHGPYDLAQLERLIPMGKLRSVDAIEVQDSGHKLLAVDLPGLRPMFEERARVGGAQHHAPAAGRPAPAIPVDPTRNTLWAVIGVLAFGLVAAALFLALR